MADDTLNLKRKQRGSSSSTSDNELRSPEEKRARDKPLNVELTSTSGDQAPEHVEVEMTHDLGLKVDLILSRLDAMNSKLESINAVVVSLEQNLIKVQGRVDRLEQDQAKSKDAIKDMHDGLQALNTIVEESKTAGDRVKNYCDDKYKDLQDKLLYAEVYQRRENLRFYGIEEKSGGKEDTHSVLQKFFEQLLKIQPEEVQEIEFQRVHRVGNKINEDGKPRAIIARFLRYRDREFIFSKTSLLKDSQFGISADLPKEIVKRRKEQSKKLIEARKSGKLAFFSRAEPDKLYIDRVLVPL